MTEKVEVNGEGRHPVYDALVRVADQEGRAGDVRWNFEKFLLASDGKPVARFSPTVTPDDPRVVDAIEGLL
jgi:glutathione peroxidase